MLFLANFSKFHKMVLFETGKGFFKTKNRVGKGNNLFYLFLIKNGKKGKRGTIYLDFDENLNFEIFGRFLTKSRFTFFGTPFTLFLAGLKKYYISAISPINIGQIGQIAKKLWEVKILSYKILYINRSRKTFVHDMLI